MDNNKYNRRSIRLKNYDYSQPGAYFITIVTHNRQCLFGEIVNGEMRLYEYGEIVRMNGFVRCISAMKSNYLKMNLL